MHAGNTLPNLLSFHALLIPIPSHYLHTLSRLMWKFIWRGKRARCSRSNLSLHKQVGGAGSVGVCEHLWAVRPNKLRWWFRNDNVPFCTEVEKSLALTKYLKAFLIDDLWKPWDTREYSPSIQAWRFINAHCKSNFSKVDYQIPLSFLEANILANLRYH